MRKTTPNDAPKVIKSGITIYKPETVGAVEMQDQIISQLLPEKYKGLSLNELFEIADKKQERKTERELTKLFANDNGVYE